MKSITDVLQKRAIVQPVNNRVSQEFQSFALYIAAQLDDMPHKGVYMRMAKKYPRPLLERALSFVSDAGARNKGALFMWKVKELQHAEK